MSEMVCEGNSRSRRLYRIEERRGYCLAWEGSGLSQAEFCRTNKISKSAFRQWYKVFKKEKGEDFIPLVLGKRLGLEREMYLGIEIAFPNQLCMRLEIPFNQLSILIQEVSHAASVIR
jgi:hypothetical protein